MFHNTNKLQIENIAIDNEYFNTELVADPGCPRQKALNPQEEALPYYFTHFFQKLHEIKKILIPTAPLNSPMLIRKDIYRSAEGSKWILTCLNFIKYQTGLMQAIQTLLPL